MMPHLACRTFFAAAFACAALCAGARPEGADLSLVPMPKSLAAGEGVFRCRTADIASVVQFARDAAIPCEGYRLEVSPDAVRVWSADDAGAFYAVQTLEQLARKTYVPDALDADPKLHASDYEIPSLRIEDAPAFRWRALMIDEARHFLGKEAVMRQIDLMAAHKLNVLHWHLVDDQGWRLDLPRHPELAQYGAVRPCSVAYGAGAEWFGKEQTLRYRLNTEPYGPCSYSPADVREIREYARARHVVIVPEIEIPGHERALLAARPDLACRGEALARVPRVYWSIEEDVLCAGNDAAVAYLEGVFDEVCELFPDSPYIHIGGDECPKKRWKECPRCQARMKAIGATDARALQAWFTRHFADYLGKKSRRVVGWDEVLYGDVPTSVVGMSWRMSAAAGAGGDYVSAAEAAAKGHDMVLTPSAYCYFSRRQGLAQDPYPYYEPEPYAGQRPAVPLTLEKAYSFDPFEGFPEKDRARILGIQASVWTESIFTRFDFEWKAWPRTCALAEVAWSGPRAHPFADFRARMERHRPRLLARHVNCAPLGEPPVGEMALSVKGGSAERQADGTWLCRAPKSYEPVWVEVTGLGDYADAIGLEYDFYASDFSVLNHCFAFLCSTDGGCTRWTNAAAPDEGVWNRVTLRRDDPNVSRFDPDNTDYIEKFADWSKVTRLRLMFLRQSPNPVAFRVGNFRPLLPARARAAKPGERRIAFARATALSARGDWEETAAFLEKVGFTDLFACVARGGHAYYESKYLPKCARLAAGRDSVRECVAACRRHGIRFHAGKANWNAEHEDTPEAFLAQMRAEGRFQATADGAECRWLCPADPRNRELELNVMKELADLGVDGLHFDYCRYRDASCCFCARCLARLSRKAGRKVSSAAEVKADKALYDAWMQLRVEDITRFVKEVADYVHAEHPGVELSASTGRTPDMGLLDRAQDWPDWARKGYLDFVSPMNYWRSPVVYRHILEQQIRCLKGSKTRLYPYIGIDCSKYTRLPAEAFLRELDEVRAHGLGGFALFALDPYAEELLPAMKAQGVW